MRSFVLVSVVLQAALYLTSAVVYHGKDLSSSVTSLSAYNLVKSAKPGRAREECPRAVQCPPRRVKRLKEQVSISLKF